MPVIPVESRAFFCAMTPSFSRRARACIGALYSIEREDFCSRARCSHSAVRGFFIERMARTQQKEGL